MNTKIKTAAIAVFATATVALTGCGSSTHEPTTAELQSHMSCPKVISADELGMDDLKPEATDGFGCEYSDGNRVVAVHARNDADSQYLVKELQKANDEDHDGLTIERKGNWILFTDDAATLTKAEKALNDASK